MLTPKLYEGFNLDDTIVEALDVDHIELYTCGYIKPDGGLLQLDEYHGEDKSLRDLKYIEYSNTHPEEDTCIRIYQRPTEDQYNQLEKIFDLYLDSVGYCKIEIWRDLRKYIYYKAFSLWEGACEDSHTEEIIGNWDGYKLIRIIKQYYGSGIVQEKINSSKSVLEKQFGGYTYDEALQVIRSQIIDILNWNDIDIKITGLDFTGSRRFGKPKEDSDLDLKMTYEGDEREDTVFNALHDENNPIRLDDFIIDINPIKDGNITVLINKDKNYNKINESKESVLYHGSSELFNNFNKQINWFSTDKSYSEQFAKWLKQKHAYLYTCKLNIKNPIDVGDTSELLFNLFPIVKPYKLSLAAKKICSQLNIEDQVLADLAQYTSAGNDDKNQYKLKLHTITRLPQFKDLCLKAGFDSIKAIEAGKVAYGVFDPDNIEILNVQDLNNNMNEGYPMPKKLYSIKDKKATWDDDAQDFIWWDSEAKSNDKYATSYKVKMSPKQFLDLTTSKGAANLKIGDELGFGKLRELDIDEFNKEAYQPCFLIISFEDEDNGTMNMHNLYDKSFTANVVGHEGRHRMFALMQAGVDEVDVQIKVTGKYYDKYRPHKINKLELIGQFNHNTRVVLNNPTVMSWETHKQINPKLNNNTL